MKSDHSQLGRELDLFATSPAIGAGLPVWLPDGAIIRAELERLAVEESARSGCLGVYTPVLAKRSLFERSGHWDKFSADMFPPMRIGGEEFVLRPANCPHHTQVFDARGRSFRDLPFRISELGSMFRSELSGVLGGLTRVRQISLDDAHVFCTPDQVGDEVRLALASIERCYHVLGLVPLFRLSVRGRTGRYLGDTAQWSAAEWQLRAALGDREFTVGEGDAAFYGPKIDVQVAGHQETVSTVQIDFNQPERFGLEYTGSDGEKHRPVMIHRGVLGSMERLTAMLIDRHAGRMPPWLAPRQVAVISVGSSHSRAARDLVARLHDASVRAQILEEGSLGGRIRSARLHRDPYIAVIGDRERDSNSVAVSYSALNAKAVLDTDVFIEAVQRDIHTRALLPAIPDRENH
ncbi:threonine--tRNA ligase [Rhodococcus sp. IEGM 1381]|uniref:threonine--tRNA ligase n=1 Tax=Rhodococcus sp. IEGM 1381 TaxID=3047085 RepID=UPI0024B679AF|nr:threonine--tRNA ligase [Rhodococcus sp. IEGM 1381]MDI9893469.1 threonine--tRNA ligase [Rhodococcus sp. IEGM 1381]